jgi:hypothetical protein
MSKSRQHFERSIYKAIEHAKTLEEWITDAAARVDLPALETARESVGDIIQELQVIADEA